MFLKFLLGLSRENDVHGKEFWLFLENSFGNSDMQNLVLGTQTSKIWRK